MHWCKHEHPQDLLPSGWKDTPQARKRPAHWAGTPGAGFLPGGTWCLEYHAVLRAAVLPVSSLDVCSNNCSPPGPVRPIYCHTRGSSVYLLCCSFIFVPLKILSLGMSNFMFNYDKNNCLGTIIYINQNVNTSLSSSHRTLPRSTPLGVHLAAAAPAWAQGPDLGVSAQAPIGLGCLAVVRASLLPCVQYGNNMSIYFAEGPQR